MSKRELDLRRWKKWSDIFWLISFIFSLVAYKAEGAVWLAIGFMIFFVLLGIFLTIEIEKERNKKVSRWTN